MRRILVVDDNEDAAQSLAMLLDLAGHEARVAHDGAAALVLAGDMRPEIILLDIGMPGMDGHEVCRRIRAQQWGEGVAVIALTGWGQEADRRRTRQAGFDGHLVKPLDPQVLTDMLDSLPRS